MINIVFDSHEELRVIVETPVLDKKQYIEQYKEMFEIKLL